MADDIFLSPEEQDERAKQWLKDNGIAIAVGIALGFGAIIGYNHYKDGVKEDAETASSLFSSALIAIEDSKNADIDSQFTQLKSDHPSSTYASKVVLMKAAQLSNIDLDEANTQLQWVVDNAPEKGLIHAARIRQIKIYISKGELDQAEKAASTKSFDGFQSHYAELLGDIDVLKGDHDAASEHYTTAIANLSASDAAYGRVLGLKLDRLAVSDSNVQEN